MLMRPFVSTSSSELADGCGRHPRLACSLEARSISSNVRQRSPVLGTLAHESLSEDEPAAKRHQILQSWGSREL